jgi:signal transduction histidine kinase
MNPSLRILHIEDSEDDFGIIAKLLQQGGVNCETIRVATRPELFGALENQTFDVILSDSRLPGFSGLQALEIAHALKPEVPFIFVSGTIGEESAIESFNHGATDYVLKDRMDRLPSAIRRALSDAEERKLKEQMQERLREVRALEAISTLSSGIAHDFNNIFAIILGHVSLVHVERERPAQLSEITDIIAQAAQRGANIVTDLTAFAQRSDSIRVITDMNQMVQDILVVRTNGFRPKVKIGFAPAFDLPGIFIDASQLEVILTEVIDNAVDSMPEGGAIALSTSLVPAHLVADLPSEWACKNYLCLKITDTGKGMPPEVRQHSFDPFYSTKIRGHGTGLGLPVVYGLMKSHHGMVRIESQLGTGTTVCLFFPTTQARSTENLPGFPMPDAELRGSETLLVAEDEPHICAFLKTILERQGYQVLAAHSYEQALTLFHAHRDEIKVVLSDIGMPRVDGISLCAELKMLKPDLKFIISSGYSYHEFKYRLDELGVDAFLPKPCTTQEVLQSVKKVLSGSVIHS